MEANMGESSPVSKITSLHTENKEEIEPKKTLFEIFFDN